MMLRNTVLEFHVITEYQKRSSDWMPRLHVSLCREPCVAVQHSIAEICISLCAVSAYSHITEVKSNHSI